MQTVDAREQMVEQQVRAWEVLDARVLSILRQVPRELFVPSGQSFAAFADVQVPLPCGQHMLRPSLAGRLLQALQLTAGERVLEVGTGSGFISACLRAAGTRVRTLEIFAELADLASANLAALGMSDVEVVNADALGAAGGLRFAAIAVTGSLPEYQPCFERQLEIGGRLFVVVGEPPVMDARLVRRVSESAWTTQSLFETVVDPLENAPRRPAFVF
ncbi:MAG: protein-L-isoaspartate O-methyltransferase [Steroidobacteraceae bacterium]